MPQESALLEPFGKPDEVHFGLVFCGAGLIPRRNPSDSHAVISAHHHNFAVGDHSIVDDDLHRVVRGAVQFHHGAVSKLGDIAEAAACVLTDADRQFHAHQQRRGRGTGGLGGGFCGNVFRGSPAWLDGMFDIFFRRYQRIPRVDGHFLMT